MPNAKKLPSGRWRVRTFEHGERKSYTADTKKEAERLAAIGIEEERAAIRRGLTLSDAIAAYIETCKAQGYSPSTIREYDARRRNSFDRIANKRLDSLTLQDVQAQLDARINAGKTAKTVRNDWFLLRATLTAFAPSLDLRRIKIARRPKRARIVFRESWASDVLRTARTFWGEDDFYLYCLLTIFAGLRPSESYALQWADITPAPIVGMNGIKAGAISVHAAEVLDAEGEYIRKAPKTAAGTRVVSVPWSFIEELHRIKARSEGRVIESPPRLATWRWKRVRASLDLPKDMRFYDLRHYYATAVAVSGATEDELAARLGHSTSAFSHSVYVELFEGRTASVNAALFSVSEAVLEASKSQIAAQSGHENGHERTGT